MSLPENSFTLKNKVKFYDPEVSLTGNVSLVYSENSELEAYTVHRALSSLTGRTIRLVNLYDFLFFESPYVDSRDYILGIIHDRNQITEFLDTAWALENHGALITCLSNVKSKGMIQLFNYNDELCEINIALSLLRKISELSNDKRSREISKELEEINSLEDWLKEKIKETKLGREIILSPVFAPARHLINKFLSVNVWLYNDEHIPNQQKEVQFITTSADILVTRRKENELRSNGINVKETLLDVDPILAPIYLTLLTYLFKEVKGGL
ncbi:hypothetical protein [Sulfolobus acidocaldarius]|uniref:Conserved protein n=4 Tax=Sulfolobus acidocaldarius TaxID=2285 RepID=Q4JA24_SULAC|nr:hypothetical protein [Sulfolobus acidocaldarius]AAY80356.1 conserved protein [Sulfolobus acidocaldarius DSM 639]AGE70937.1 hypothetical protein SacN8_04830 [Sulfolobus acidocaldarius N8]AGE73208.1 hypothetical protein SacRon12I_04820 [Sulfolobus acidocaldarius Ron12/I]ALU28757.1 hypothetical protein ATY89_01475 [Sulfolobus acidocaldarius]ALU31477.1 hypothetical protein ATZ20_04510 [Sulfolobus acidocaldarius]